jgi:hypothetical protein
MLPVNVTATGQVAWGATDWHWLTSAVKLVAFAPVIVAPRFSAVVPVLVMVMVWLAVLPGFPAGR